MPSAKRNLSEPKRPRPKPSADAALARKRLAPAMTGEAALHLRRLRRFCFAFPGTMEKVSHGEPTFFAPNGVFAMFSNNHHRDGRSAVWIPAAPGMQQALIHLSPKAYYRPPYVGVSGWSPLSCLKSATKNSPLTLPKPGP